MMEVAYLLRGWNADGHVNYHVFCASEQEAKDLSDIYYDPIEDVRYTINKILIAEEV